MCVRVGRGVRRVRRCSIVARCCCFVLFCFIFLVEVDPEESADDEHVRVTQKVQ